MGGVPYDAHEVEARWRARWEADGLYRADVTDPRLFYNLAEFPYPSAAGLHVGHVFKYCGLDVYGRYQRMRGREVFQPIGFDSFGINAENYAMKVGREPSDVIAETIVNFRRQLSSVGIGWDWSREIVTSDPSYYRWTQWLFVRLFEAGLAYRAEAPVIWCPSCATVLAREQVEGDRCERCDSLVTERVLTQWFLRMTAYADRLRAGLDSLDWPERAKRLQRNWLANLHDWNISRQRKWGPPIPIVHCPTCGPVAVPDDQLPVLLGADPDTTCPSCGGPARRETDVSDTFFDSSWYFLCYPSIDHGVQATQAGLDDRPWDAERVKPVDFYAGGPEHVQRHHLYARFVTMALHDLGLVPFEEPFPRIRLGGVIVLDGAKMSKSRGNVVSPDDLLAAYGADVTRLHLLFSGPWEQGGEYRSERSGHAGRPASVAGIERFLSRVWRLDPTPDAAVEARTIDRVTAAIETLRFNVAIAALMEAAGALEPRTLVRLLAPLAPHVAEELWARQGQEYSVHQAPWPDAAPVAAGVTLVVQVDGKVRDRLLVPAGLDEASARDLALASPHVQAAVGERAVRRTVHVMDRLVNLVVAP